jgi:aminoglycoside phosphotransferase
VGAIEQRRTPLQIAAPAGLTISWIDGKNMGLPSVRRKRADIDQMQLATDPIPGLAISKD